MEDEVIYHEGTNGTSWPTDIIMENPDTLKELKNALVYVNIHTIIRNALTAFDKSDRLEDALTTIADRVDSDIMLLKHFLMLNHNTDVIVYTVDYSNIKFGAFARRIEAKTDKQKILAKVTEKALELTKDFATAKFVREFKNPDPMERRSTYVLTHVALDLLKASSFNHLKLLDSFTGNIREFQEFNSKINVPKEYRDYIPLTEVTLRVFGDGFMFAPQPIATRKILLEIAKKSNWTPLTTEGRVIFSVDRHDKPLADALKNLTRS